METELQFYRNGYSLKDGNFEVYCQEKDNNFLVTGYKFYSSYRCQFFEKIVKDREYAFDNFEEICKNCKLK